MNDMTTIKNAWDFPVDTWNLAAVKEGHGISVPQSMARCIVRTDTNEVLGVHGSKYKAIKHDDVVNTVFDAVNKSGISKDYQEKIEVFDNGAKLRGTINFPDLVIEPAVGDHIHFQIVFFNSYDGSWAFGQQAQGLRLWCLNGCTSPDTVAKTVAKHTANVDIVASSAKIQLGLSAFFNSKELYQKWMKVDVPDLVAENFFKGTLCHVKTKTSEHKHNIKQLENIMGLWSGNAGHLGKNKWALYNTMTEWATHTQESRSPANTRRIRENQVARAMNELTYV
jgi:hypothetical protein